MLLFITALYLPLSIALTLSYDVTNYSISEIGWQRGGMLFLIAFVISSIPFYFYQIRCIFINGKQNKSLIFYGFLGGILLFVGGCTPCDENHIKVWTTFHKTLVTTGVTLMIYVVARIKIYYFQTLKNRTFTVFAYVILLCIYMATMCVFGVCALFQMLLANGVFISLTFINRSYVRLRSPNNSTNDSIIL